MRYLAEERAQCWRAVGILPSGVEVLIFVGRSASNVREHYITNFNDPELFDESFRTNVEILSMQRWSGAPDAGRWEDIAKLSIPGRSKKTARAAA
ncbi:MAG: hypothetical protein R3B84_01520 [Zavarzinella sp.]